MVRWTTVSSAELPVPWKANTVGNEVVEPSPVYALVYVVAETVIALAFQLGR